MFSTSILSLVYVTIDVVDLIVEALDLKHEVADLIVEAVDLKLEVNYLKFAIELLMPVNNSIYYEL